MIYALGAIAICLAWLLPGHWFPWASFQQEVLAALGAGLIGLAVLVSTGLTRYRVARIVVVSIALAAVPMLQWLGGMIPFLGDALLCTLYLTAFALCIVAAQAMSDARGDQLLFALFAAFLVAAIASTGIGLVQWLQLDGFAHVEVLPRGDRVYANITQPNNFASLLALGVVCLLWLYLTRRIGGACLSLAMAFLGFGLVMTQSRTGWAFVIGLAVWIMVMRSRLAMRVRPAIVVTALVLFAIATALWPTLNGALDQTLVHSGTERVASVGGRPGHWLTLLDALSRSPWLGYGWLQVSRAQQVAVLDHPAQHEWITYSHSGALDLLIFNGVPLGLMLIGAGAWWMVSRLRQCRDVNSWALLAAIGSLLIHAMLEFPLAYAYFLLPLGLLIGMLESRQAAPAARLAVPAIPRSVFAVFLVGMMGMLAWVWIEYLQVEDAARRMRFKEAGYVMNGQTASVPDVMLLDNQREFVRFRLTAATEGMSNAELDMMRTVSQKFAPPAALLRYAIAAGLNGREAEASRSLKLLCHLWSTRTCDEVRNHWKVVQKEYPRLRSIDFPPSPDAPAAASH